MNYLGSYKKTWHVFRLGYSTCGNTVKRFWIPYLKNPKFFAFMYLGLSNQKIMWQLFLNPIYQVEKWVRSYWSNVPRCMAAAYSKFLNSWYPGPLMSMKHSFYIEQLFHVFFIVASSVFNQGFEIRFGFYFHF